MVLNFEGIDAFGFDLLLNFILERKSLSFNLLFGFLILSANLFQVDHEMGFDG